MQWFSNCCDFVAPFHICTSRVHILPCIHGPLLWKLSCYEPLGLAFMFCLPRCEVELPREMHVISVWDVNHTPKPWDKDGCVVYVWQVYCINWYLMFTVGSVINLSNSLPDDVVIIWFLNRIWQIDGWQVCYCCASHFGCALSPDLEGVYLWKPVAEGATVEKAMSSSAYA